jgi:hypothetical protein
MENKKSGETGIVGFSITGGRGFKITFDNGVTASVQFGYGNYCENRFHKMEVDYPTPNRNGEYYCPNAEVAAWDKEGNWITKKVIKTGEDVAGWIAPKEVLAFLNKCAKRK